MLASEIGPERTRANSRHSNAKFAKLCPQDIGQTDDGEFCGAIRAAPAKAHEPALLETFRMTPFPAFLMRGMTRRVTFTTPK